MGGWRRDLGGGSGGKKTWIGRALGRDKKEEEEERRGMRKRRRRRRGMRNSKEK